MKKVRKMNKKQVIRLNERQLRQIVTESVKKVINEHYSEYDGEFRNKPYRVYDGQLTAKELISELQKFAQNEPVEVYVGNNTFKTISDVHPENNSLFLSGLEYDKWKESNDTALQKPYSNPYDDHGEGWQ